MATKPRATVTCNICQKRVCRYHFPNGIPDYCVTNKYPEIIEKAKKKYSAPDNADIYRASAKVVADGYQKWGRIQEAIEFARDLKLSKVGFASCVALVHELELITKLFIGAGFQTVSVACQVGGVSAKERGFPDITDPHGTSCNPIAQAEILNSEETQLNFIVGLCLGHDLLFTRHSKAPVSTLIVKDRVTGHNPAAVLYAFHTRQALTKLYCNEDTY